MNYKYAVVLSALAVAVSAASTEDDIPTSDDPLKSFLLAISMIGVSEIGDKTFLIAALMAMRHPRLVVFAASASSLAIMTILSGIVGHALPALIPQRYTQFLAGLLFLVFGAKLAKEGLEMAKDAGVDEELAEVEEEIAVSNMNDAMDARESAKLMDGPSPNVSTRVKNIFSLIFSPIFVQVFIMVFLGEWGDRSQIATIAMAAGSNYWYVIMGAIVGHFICTAAAVIGGKLLATKISMRTVTLGGAFSFFVFSVLYLLDAFSAQAQA